MLSFFDKLEDLEDNIRAVFSRCPIIYAFVGGEAGHRPSKKVRAKDIISLLVKTPRFDKTVFR